VKVKVVLFKPSGKYYSEEEWDVPHDALGPYDMCYSPNFRRIDGGPVLVESQEPWGYPYLFPEIAPAEMETRRRAAQDIREFVLGERRKHQMGDYEARIMEMAAALILFTPIVQAPQQ
jgi:hypothetical protein